MKNQYLNIEKLNQYEIYLVPLIYLPIFLSEAKINHNESITKGFPHLGELIYKNTIDCVCYILMHVILA